MLLPLEKSTTRTLTVLIKKTIEMSLPGIDLVQLTYTHTQAHQSFCTLQSVTNSDIL